MEAKYLFYLKKEVQETFGRRILTSTDCRYLYQDISQQHYKISFNTLRRFFYLMHSKHKQSPYTLDILSNYCGFASWDDFITTYQENEFESSSQNNDLMHFLVSNFKYTEVNNANDSTFFSLIYQVIHFLERQPHLMDKFQRKIAKTYNGQVFYFEQSINIDKLNTYFGSGIRHYMVAKKTLDANIYGNYLKCLKGWLSSNNTEVIKHYELLKIFDAQKINVPHIIGYKKAAQIYFHFAFEHDLERTLLKIRQIHAGFTINNENFTSAFRFEIHIITALILCKQFEEALFYLEDIHKINQKYPLSFSDKKLFELIPLYEAHALYHLKKEAHALKVFEHIDPTKFHFLHKQYSTILYLAYKLYLRKTNSEKNQFKNLIEQTGFTRLNSFVEN